MRVTLEKSRVREICMPGSVRAKPNGLATRPSPVTSCMGVTSVAITARSALGVGALGLQHHGAKKSHQVPVRGHLSAPRFPAASSAPGTSRQAQRLLGSSSSERSLR